MLSTRDNLYSGMERAGKRTVGVKGKGLHGQAREVIANVIEFMETEATNGRVSIPLDNFTERVLAATKISKSSYYRILKEKREIEDGARSTFTTPSTKRARPSPKSELPQKELEAIREIIRNFYETEKKNPSVKGIYRKIKQGGLSFNGGLSTLAAVIKKMGFEWKKPTYVETKKRSGCAAVLDNNLSFSANSDDEGSFEDSLSDTNIKMSKPLTVIKVEEVYIEDRVIKEEEEEEEAVHVKEEN